MILTACILAACGPAEKNRPSAIISADSSYLFTYNGTIMAPGMAAENILSSLGEPKNYYEADSCAAAGKNRYYSFDHFTLTTFMESGSDSEILIKIDLTDDVVSTNEGIYLGSPVSDVDSIYGVPSRTENNCLFYDKGDMTLTILTTDGLVSNIYYEKDGI